MATKKTVAKQPITIRLTYNPDGTVTSRPASRFHKGDQVKFVSGNGGHVYVKLNSDAYQPSVFTPESGPVKVIAAPTGTTSKAECGIVIEENGKTVIYGWVPPSLPRSEGTTVIKLSKGIETEP
jgi:hypothetical protein